MARGEPPDWALPSWDAGETGAGRTAGQPAGGPSTRGLFGSGPAGTFGLRILQVSEVTRAVREAVRQDERLREVWVEGEVGRVTVSSAGHAYFTLKDERSQLACVFFRDDRLASPFEPRPGLRVVAQGRVDIFETQGVYQLYVASVQPAGFGDLALRFEALKARLATEGLFEVARKRALPDRPRVVGVATSPSGAVWHDIQNVLRRRWPLARVIFVPCQVQGEGAPASIIAALARLGRFADQREAAGRPDEAPQVTILARGGGSLEDLWPFNDERVVRAVAGHPVPIVCGVGHETDVTLADFAADLRAPTPSAAAELVTPDRTELAAALAAIERRRQALALGRVGGALRDLGQERRALDRLHPRSQLAAARERSGLLLDRAARVVHDRLAAGRSGREGLAGRLVPAVGGAVGSRRADLERSAAALRALDPQATLDRGYAIVRRAADGRVVRAPVEAPAGTPLALRLARGELAATSGSGPSTPP